MVKGRQGCLPPKSRGDQLTWISDVPLELRVLTLPERVLVARHFPAAYIVKLYPKKRGLDRGHRPYFTLVCEGTCLRIG
jgi:hypothetical protein